MQLTESSDKTALTPDDDAPFWYEILRELLEAIDAINFGSILANGTRDQKLTAIYVLRVNTRLHMVPTAHEDQIIKENTRDVLEQLQIFKEKMRLTQAQLTAEIWEGLPTESAVRYRKLFGGADAVFDKCLQLGGPWHHFRCGTEFNVDPGDPPICSCCYPAVYDNLKESYSKRQQIKPEKILTDAHMLAGKEFNFKPPSTDEYKYLYHVSPADTAFPKTCDSCGGPAYKGLNEVICKNRCPNPQ